MPFCLFETVVELLESLFLVFLLFWAFQMVVISLAIIMMVKKGETGCVPMTCCPSVNNKKATIVLG